MSASVLSVPMPAGYGMAIPHNPKDLLKMIESQKKAKHTTPSSSMVLQPSQISSLPPPVAQLNHTSYDRLKKQQGDRESYEARLMALEDYSHTKEGKMRLQRWEDRLNMESEDAASIQLKELFKDYDKQRFRNRIRVEVEARKTQEKAEREERRRAAEIRRAAVVERLRKQAEAEEQRKREAELLLQRIEEEKLRKEREEHERFISNQQCMVMEDQWSALVEQDYRDQLVLQAWKQREKEKLLAWEREQAEKDKRDEELRQQRLVELEAKRKKLEELRAQQQANSATDSNVSLKQEGERISKQMRIQNRAKFVSKKITKKAEEDAAKTGLNPEDISNIVSVSLEGNAADASHHVQQLHGASEVMGLDEAVGDGLGELPHKVPIASQNAYDDFIFNTHNSSGVHPIILRESSKYSSSKHAMSVKMAGNKIVSVDDMEEMKAFNIEIENYSEKEIKSSQQDILNLKRALRMKMKDEAGMDDSSKTGGDIDILNRKYELLQLRLDGIVHSKDTSTMHSTIPTTRQPLTNAVSSTSQQPNAWEAVSKKIESLLRDYHKYQIPPHTHSLYTHPHHAQSHIQPADKLPYIDEHGIRSLTLLLMDLKQIQSEYKSLKAASSMDDDMDYDGKITQAVLGIQTFLNFIDKHPSVMSAVQISMHSPRMSRPGSAVKPSTNSTLASNYPKTAADNPHSSSESTAMISSRSAPVLPDTKPSPSAPTPSPSASTPEPIPSSFHETTPLPLADLLITSSDDVENRDGVSETKADGDVNTSGDREGTEEEDPSTLPGWEECLYTSMHSAAHHAAYYGYIDILRFLCRYFDCFILDVKGRTPLYYACLGGHLDCVADLVSIDPVYIEVGDSKGETPLHAAAKTNSVQVLAFLLSCEVHPDTANHSGLTSSHFAKSKEALMVLSQANAALYCVDNHSRMPLWYACNLGNVELVDYLCAQYPKEYMLWPDDEGETCLHKASSQGHAQVVEVLCKHISSAGTIHTLLNKKNYSALHVASNAKVLQVFYEYGCNLWLEDVKQRNPLFFAAFFGRVDCVEMLMNLALSSNKEQNSHEEKASSNCAHVPEQLSHADIQGDTALHAASLCGHMPCVCLLSFILYDLKNKNNLTPADLAEKANHKHIVTYLRNLSAARAEGRTQGELYGSEVDFSLYASFITYYGSRYCINYDLTYEAYYYLDRMTNNSSWEVPLLLDMHPKDVEKFQKACTILIQFYTAYNPEKLPETNTILSLYQHRYTELFITLANKYNVQDLSMFKGVDFDY